jgi:thioesterase domain-containing protein
MRVPALLAELRSRDIQIWAHGDRLRCNAPADVLTPELRDQLLRRKNDILEFLLSAGVFGRQPRAIVPLQPRGSGIPVFAVGGHNGDVFCYRALVQHLGDDQPFYGLQPPGLDDHSKLIGCIEDLAAYFAAQIRAFRPAGPYIIAGFCAGGTIAFELARQLVQEHAEINILALFGSVYPTWYRPLRQIRHHLRHHVERVLRYSRTLRSLRSGERRFYIAETLRKHKKSLASAQPVAPDPVLVLRARVERATIEAVRRYTPRQFAGSVSLFMPSRAWLGSDYQLRWHSVAQHADEYFGPDGCNSDNMLREPYAPVFAELFRRCSARSAI